MEETPSYPSVARVLRIKPGPNEKPAQGFSWDDYEDVEANNNLAESGDFDGEDDDGWGVVKSRKRRKLSSNSPPHFYSS